MNTCENCAAFSALHNQCRANPPVAFLIMIPNGQSQWLGTWPPATKDGWCCAWRSQSDEDKKKALSANQNGEGP